MFEEEKEDVDKICTQLALTCDSKKVTVGIFAKLKKITIAQSLFFFFMSLHTVSLLLQLLYYVKLKKNYRCTGLFIATTILLCQCTTILAQVFLLLQQFYYVNVLLYYVKFCLLNVLGEV